MICSRYVSKHFVECRMQNRHQKVFSRGALHLCRGLGIVKIGKIPLIYSVSYFNLGLLGALFGGLVAHQSPPVATGLAVCETWKSVVVPRSNWLPNNCRKAFAHFGQVDLMCMIVVKNFAHFGQGWFVWLKIAVKIERISCVNVMYFYWRQNHKLEVRFDLNFKPTTNDVYWRKFLI